MITVDTVDLSRLASHLDELQRALGAGEVESALMAGALVLEGQVKINIQRMGAIDTGFLLNSIYSTSKADSGYREARTRAQGRGDGRMLPEVNTGRGEAAVSAGAEYAVHVEYGTCRMAARPFMRQAVQTHADEAVDAIGDAIGRKMEQIFR